jgi:hypothetical protein
MSMMSYYCVESRATPARVFPRVCVDLRDGTFRVSLRARELIYGIAQPVSV